MNSTARIYPQDANRDQSPLLQRALELAAGIAVMIPPYAQATVGIDFRKREAPRVVLAVKTHWVATEVTNREETIEALVNQALTVLRDQGSKIGHPVNF